MIVIRISRRWLIVAAIMALTALVAFNVSIYNKNREMADKLTLLNCLSNQLDNANMFKFLVSASLESREGRPIEVFDVIKGDVIRRINSTPSLQNEAENSLKGITGMYTKVKAFPEKGYIIKVPLDPAMEVNNQWLRSKVNDVFIIFPHQESPYLMVLDSKKRPLFFNFNASVSEFQKLITT